MGINGEFHPWRRFLARSLDISVYSTLWSIFLMFVFRANLSFFRNNFIGLFNSFVALFIMLLLEPLLLHLYGTTLGKAIFGLRVESQKGRRLSYSEGFERTWNVIGKGLGYNIPIYNLVRLWKSYKKCSENETQPWNLDISYTIKDTKAYRGVLFVAANIVIFAVLATAFSAQQLPPNRGDLTVAEFVENYNYYADYYDIDFGDKYLSSSGKWTEKEFDGRHYVDIFGANRCPDYNYITENGYVTEIFFDVELENNENWIRTYEVHMILTSLSFTCAQEEMGLFSKIPQLIARQIGNNSFKDFKFTVAGIEISNTVSHEGYITADSYVLIPDEDVAENYFRLHFSIRKVKY